MTDLNGANLCASCRRIRSFLSVPAPKQLQTGGRVIFT